MLRLNGGLPILLYLALFSHFPSSIAASFDCSKASTLVENATCTDPELSSFDDNLASLYSQTLRQASSAIQVKKSQRAWLKKRNMCQSKRCLKNIYHERLAKLRSSPSTPSMVLPSRLGGCVTTKIVDKNTHFEGPIPAEDGGEIYLTLANQVGLYLAKIPHLAPYVNPDAYMAQRLDFAKGDRVRLCLISLPQDCPPGDD